MTKDEKDEDGHHQNRLGADGTMSALEFFRSSRWPIYRLQTQLRMAKGLFDTCYREVYSDVHFNYGTGSGLGNHATGVKLGGYLRAKFPKLAPAAAGTLSEVFVHCDGTKSLVDEVTHSKRNPDQVLNALDFLADMVKTARISAADIAIITPYAANVELVNRRRMRPEYEALSAMPPAATVDSFQGREADIIDKMVFSQLEEGVIACCERIRQCVTVCSAAELQADPRLREELKTAEAKIGLQAQTELLQLVKSSGWSTTRLSMTKALWETFPVGPEDADTQRRFEVDRTASISRAGKLTGAENPNAFRFPGRQIRRRTQAPVTRTPTLAFTPKHSLPQLDTLTPKRPRGDEPTTPGLPTPTSAPKQSTRLSTLPAVDYSLPSPAKVNTEACESDETFEDSEEEPESDVEFDDLEERLLDNEIDYTASISRPGKLIGVQNSNAKLAQRLEDFIILVARPINVFFWMGVFPVQNKRLFALERFVAVFAWEWLFISMDPRLVIP
ncbi:hypothetical protein J3E68DRAFT_425293 [Trichoderma sp. SZMC 28012]